MINPEDLEQEVRRLHKELGKKESDLCEIQKLASIGNWEWNIEQQILIWSDEVYRIFGFEPGSFKPPCVRIDVASNEN